MRKALANWFFKDAEWYQFWLPGSGALGGLILGAILFSIVMILALI